MQQVNGLNGFIDLLVKWPARVVNYATHSFPQ